MSFGKSTGMSAATGGEQGAIPALGQGLTNIQSGANFFQTLLGGNKANTAAALQPDINRIKEATQGALQGASTLMPRGGGRYATLFDQPFQTQKQIGNLFSGMRTAAGQALPQIGGQQAQIGQTAASNLFNQDLAQKKMLNDFIQGLAQTAMSGAAQHFAPAG